MGQTTSKYAAFRPISLDTNLFQACIAYRSRFGGRIHMQITGAAFVEVVRIEVLGLIIEPWPRHFNAFVAPRHPIPHPTSVIEKHTLASINCQALKLIHIATPGQPCSVLTKSPQLALSREALSKTSGPLSTHEGTICNFIRLRIILRL